MNYESGQIQAEELRDGKVIKQQDIMLGHVAFAEMQYNRDGTRIALIMRSGELGNPLGELHYNDEPEQYVVLMKLRALIGQTPTAAK